MASSKIILKVLFSLCVWSFVIIGLFKMHGNNIVPQEYVTAQLSGRILLQKDMLRYGEVTSTTTDRFDPSEILVDNRTGKYELSKVQSKFCRINRKNSREHRNYQTNNKMLTCNKL